MREGHAGVRGMESVRIHFCICKMRSVPPGSIAYAACMVCKPGFTSARILTHIFPGSLCAVRRGCHAKEQRGLWPNKVLLVYNRISGGTAVGRWSEGITQVVEPVRLHCWSRLLYLLNSVGKSSPQMTPPRLHSLTTLRIPLLSWGHTTKLDSLDCNKLWTNLPQAHQTAERLRPRRSPQAPQPPPLLLALLPPLLLAHFSPRLVLVPLLMPHLPKKKLLYIFLTVISLICPKIHILAQNSCSLISVTSNPP